MATALRSDARANQKRIVDAARSAFAADGPDVRMEEIARRAGVGVGTVYRRFPAKADLVSAILDERVADLLELFAEHADDEPCAALDAFFEAMVRLQAQDRGVIRLMAQSLGPAAYPDNMDDLIDAVWRVIRRGQRAGSLRRDIRRDDVVPLVRMASAALDERADDNAGCAAALRRARVLLDGLAA